MKRREYSRNVMLPAAHAEASDFGSRRSALLPQSHTARLHEAGVEHTRSIPATPGIQIVRLTTNHKRKLKASFKHCKQVLFSL